MSFAGQQLTAGRIPGERIATSTEDTSSSAFSSETQIGTVTAALVGGRTYLVRCVAKLGSGTDGNLAIVRFREDSTSGAIRDRAYGYLSSTTSSREFPVLTEFEYTALSTGNKTFVVTAEAVSGTVLRTISSGAQRTTVDYISG